MTVIEYGIETNYHDDEDEPTHHLMACVRTGSNEEWVEISRIGATYDDRFLAHLNAMARTISGEGPR